MNTIYYGPHFQSCVPLFRRGVAAVRARAEHERERFVVGQREANALVLRGLLVLVEAPAWGGLRRSGAALRLLPRRIFLLEAGPERVRCLLSVVSKPNFARKYALELGSI